MITSVRELLMNYFSDDRPVSARTFRSHRCADGIVDEAISKGYIAPDGTDVDGYILYRIVSSINK